jgi:selenocysteine lyase/cysteine desulfurase
MMDRKSFLQLLPFLAGGAAVLDILSQRKAISALMNKPWPTVDPNSEEFWRFVREQFPLSHERAYLNTGGLGPSPYVVIDAVKAKMDELEKSSETGRDDEIWRDIKNSAAKLLGCEPEELAFTRNTTEGVNIVANGLPLRRGDEIITTTQEHVGNALPWLALHKRAGVSIKLFEPSTASSQENLDRISALISKRTRLISVPHVVTTTGLILPVEDIAAMARAKRLWFFVDGAQSAGMFPFNVHDMGCDAYATSGHKWLMGPKETGLLFVRKDMLDTVDAKFVGAFSDAGFDFLRGTFAFNPSAQRYEYGTVNVPLRVGLGAAIGFIQKIGIDNIWKRDEALSATLYAGLREIAGVHVLSPDDQRMRSAMITLMHERVPHLELQEHLDTYKLRTRSVTEGGLAALRISTHIYNQPEEIDRVLEGVRTAGNKAH